MKKKLLLLVLAFVIAFSFAACNAETMEKQNAAISRNPSFATEVGSWAVYWYLCGNDLESSRGFATDDFTELTEMAQFGNVNVIIETGSTSIWQSDVMDTEKF